MLPAIRHAVIEDFDRILFLTGATVAALGEIIYGNLEWAYHESDGEFKMGLWPHLSVNKSA